LIDEFGMTHQQVSESVGRSRAAVSNLLRLRELPEEVKKLVDEGELDMGHARALLGLEKAVQTEVARKVVRQGLSVRETEALVRKALSPGKTGPSQTRRDPDVERLERDLADRLGARVEIQPGKGGRGKLVVHYKSNDELEGIIGKLG
jgi:ParB family chromosome partitioning protein